MDPADFEDHLEDAVMMDVADAEARQKMPQGARDRLDRFTLLADLLR